MWRCNQCGTENSENFEFCGRCGKPRSFGYQQQSSQFNFNNQQQSSQYSTGSQQPVRQDRGCDGVMVSRKALIISIVVVAVAILAVLLLILSGGSSKNEAAVAAPTPQVIYVTPKPTSKPASTPAPTPKPAPTPEPAPTLSDLQAILGRTWHPTVSDTGASLRLPKSEEMLSYPFQATVDAPKSIYVMPRPEAGHGNLGTIAEGTKVWIVAEKSGFYFFVAEDDTMGWNGKKYFDY